MINVGVYCFFCFFKQKTAYEMRISDWSSDVCSSDLLCSQSIGSIWILSRINRAPVSAATYARRFAASNPMSALDRAPEVSDRRNVALTCGGEYSPPLPSNFIVSVLSSPGSLMTIMKSDKGKCSVYPEITKCYW